MRHLLKTLTVLAAIALPLNMAGATPADPRQEARQALVNEMTNAVLSILKDQKKPAADRESTLERGFADMVDTGWIAKFVLGSWWREASDDQRQRYTKLYGMYLAKIYISNYAESKQRQIRDINPVGINDEPDNNYTVRTEVLFSDDSAIRVDYLISESKDSNKIIDVVIEGVSLLATHRSEFSRLAANKGVDGVIARLEELVKAPAPAITLSMK
jgi:phospholipid transport system substrate-binding protein